MIRTEPKILTRHVPAMLPRAKTIARLAVANVVDLDVYTFWTESLSGEELGTDEQGDLYSLPVSYPDVFVKDEYKGYVQANGPSLLDVEVHEKARESFREALKSNYGDQPHYQVYGRLFTSMMEAVHDDLWKESIDGCSLRSLTRRRLVQLLLSWLEALYTGLLHHKPHNFYIGPQINWNHLDTTETIVSRLRYFREKFPSLQYYLVGWDGMPWEERQASRIEKETGLKIIRLGYRAPENYRNVSALGLLMQYGEEAVRHMAVEKHRFTGLHS